LNYQKKRNGVERRDNEEKKTLEAREKIKAGMTLIVSSYHVHFF
jgi:hypothetical protein